MSEPAPSDLALFEADLDQLLVACYAQPLRYVETMFAWGDGELRHETGPKPWQRAFLLDLGVLIRTRAFNGIDPVRPIKMAISSGVGPGKTALIAWVLHFLMDTRADCKCRVTANTVTQLDTSTWAEIRKWGALKLTAPRWAMNTETMYHLGDRVNWFAVKTTCAPENAQAFAGWHNRRSTTANFYDEASTIDDLIFDKGRGIEVDGESFQFVFGNPSRRHGQLYRAVFGSERDEWNHRIIDGEEHTTSPVTRELYQHWADTYGGVDGDYYRVHVKGLPPNTDELQFIDAGRIHQAQMNVPQALASEPLVCGVDISGGGSSWTVCRFRRGFDARTLPPIRLTGEQTTANDRQLVIAKLADALLTHQPAAMFIDSAFGAVIVSVLKQMGFTNVFEVNFGGPSADGYGENLRASMWRMLKDWLPKGAIDPKDVRLATDLGGPGFHINRRNKLVLEAKQDMQRRGIASPDDADALALTWAMPIPMAPPRRPSGPVDVPARGGGSWMGFG